MKTKKLFSLLAVGAISLSLFAFTLPGYTIKGTITGKTHNTIYLSHEQNGTDITDSAAIVNGKFVFKGVVSEPSFYTLKLSNDPKDYNQTMVLLDNAAVTISVRTDTLYKSIVTGLPDNDIYNEFYKTAWKSVTDSAGKIYAQLDIADQHGKVKLDSATQKEFDNKFAGLDVINFNVISAFVQQHPASVASAAIIVDRFINFPSFGKADTVYGYLTPAVKNSSFGKQIKAAVDLNAKLGIGKPAPDFTQPDTLGNPLSLSSFKGKYVLVDFWASWCGPCRAENPNVVKAYKKYHDKGFEIIGVSLDNNKASWLKAVHADGLSWYHVADLKGWKNDAAKTYGITAVPQNFLMDKNGNIIGKSLRGNDLDKALAAALK